MTMKNANPTPLILIVGGGASGFYAAERLLEQGFQVLMFNADKAIGGGTRYYVRYDKAIKMKLPLLGKFLKTLQNPNFLNYYGGITIGNNEPLSIDDLLNLNPSALVVTTGSRGNIVLNLPGIDLKGVYNAYNNALTYNHAPHFENKTLSVGKHVSILGVGNVSADMIYWLSNQKEDEVKEITVYARRGPFEFKMKHPEVKENLPYFDPKKLVEEFKRVLKIIYEDETLPYFSDKILDEEKGEVIENKFKLTKDLEKDVEIVLNALLFPKTEIPKILKCAQGEIPVDSHTAKVSFHFLTQPESLDPKEDDPETLNTIHLSHNKLVVDPKSGKIKSEKIDCEYTPHHVDTFIYSIGSVLDPELGLQTKEGWPVPDPKFPYRIKHKDSKTKKESTLWAFGWSRRPSKGLVGEAKIDVSKGIPDLINYLKQNPGDPSQTVSECETLLKKRKIKATTKKEIISIHQKELTEMSLMSPSDIEVFLK